MKIIAALLAFLFASPALAQTVPCPNTAKFIDSSVYTLSNTDVCLWLIFNYNGLVQVHLPAPDLTFLPPTGYKAVILPVAGQMEATLTPNQGSSGRTPTINGQPYASYSHAQSIEVRVGPDNNWYAVASSANITLTGAVTGSGSTTIVTSIGTGVITNANLVNQSITFGSTTANLGASIPSISSLILANSTLQSPAVTGTVSGSPTFSGTPTFSGLSSAVTTTILGLDGSNRLVTTTGGGGGTPGGSSGQIQYNNSNAFDGFTMAGDCTFSVPSITCTKTQGSAFVASATTDATNAANISSGNLAAARYSTNLASAFKTAMGSSSGAIFYDNGSTIVPLAIGSNGKVLQVSSNLPSWQSASAPTPSALSTGLANTPGTYNAGAQTLSGGDTLSLQTYYLGHAISFAVAAADAGYRHVPTAGSLTATVANPGAVGSTPVYSFGYDGTHSYTITTTSGTASIYGCEAAATSITVSYSADLVSDGTNYACRAYAAPTSLPSIASLHVLGRGTGTGTAADTTLIAGSGMTITAGSGTITFASSGSGGVSGPGSSVNTDLATWSGTGGATLADSGILLASVATATNSMTFTGKSMDAGQLTGTVLDARLSAAAQSAMSFMSGQAGGAL